MVKTVECSQCEGEIELGAWLVKGDTICCPHCFEEFTVVSVRPLRIEMAGEAFVENAWYVDD